MSEDEGEAGLDCEADEAGTKMTTDERENDSTDGVRALPHSMGVA